MIEQRLSKDARLWRGRVISINGEPSKGGDKLFAYCTDKGKVVRIAVLNSLNMKTFEVVCDTELCRVDKDHIESCDFYLDWNHSDAEIVKE